MFNNSNSNILQVPFDKITMGNCFGLKRKSKTVDRNEDISSIISNGAPLTCPAASSMHPDMEIALRRGEELAKDLNLGKILHA